MSHDIRLVGTQVVLEPLSCSHTDELVRAANRGRSTYEWTYVPHSEGEMRVWVEQALKAASAGSAVPFVTRRVDGEIVGSTRFAALDRWTWSPAQPPIGDDVRTYHGVEIGWTWLSEPAQRSAVNTEAKLLMLRHAFEVWRVVRVTIKTDARNTRSRAAIERLGARLDGVLRAHLPAMDGRPRDSAMYSILETEWPDLERCLLARLARG